MEANSIFDNTNVIIIVEIISVIILLICSGLISASEISFFSLSNHNINKIRQEKTTISKKILALLKKPEYLLSTILIANNFVNISITLISTFLTAILLKDIDNSIVIVLIQLVGITFLILFFGEILPKTIATKKYYKITKIMVYPLTILKYLCFPLSYLLVKFTNIIKKRIKKKDIDKISIEEISEAISYASDLDEEKEMLEDIVNSNSLDVKEIMTSRIDVFAIDYNSPFTKIIGQIVESGFSRIPVYVDNLDNIKGILYIKDVLPFLNIEDKENFYWQKLIRQAFIVPENKKIIELLSDFQKRKQHIAIIVDEYGGVSGIATLEDILEEYIGEIHDESDTEGDNNSYTKIANNIYEFDAKTSIIDFCKITDIDYNIFQEIKGDSETIAGLLLETNGTIPQKNTKISINNIDFIILASNERKIIKVKIIIK